jgi:hypothetical protein
LWPFVERRPPTWLRPAAGLVAVFLLFAAFAAWLQWANGAYQSEFGEEADAAAHYVTSLMVRDYIAAGLPAPPLEYAKDYYQHYPKIGLGHWPPMFYMLQAGWMLVFGVSRTSVLLFQAVLAGLLATALFAAARRQMPAVVGAVAAGVLLVHPTTQRLAREVMAELLTATLIFLALWCWWRFLETEAPRYAAAFGALAGIALLTKGTAAMLVPIPVLSLLIAGKLRLLGGRWFWLSGLLAGAIAAPWYIVAPGAMHQRAVPGLISANEAYVVRSGMRYFSLAGHGLAVWVLVALAVLIAARLLRRRPVEGIWAVGVSALAAMVLLRTLVPPARELRHLLNVLPFWLLFAAAGLWWALSLGPFKRRLVRWRAAGAALLFVALFALEFRPPPRKDCGGYEEVARAILARPEWTQSVILVSSDALGEGMLISELAMRERRPGHIVLRGSKVLSASSWFGWNARPLFSGPKQVGEFLSAVPVGLVVFDGEPMRPPAHHQMLQLALRGGARSWELVGQFPQRRRPGDRRDGIYLYRLIGHEGTRPARVPRQLSGGPETGDSRLHPQFQQAVRKRRNDHRSQSHQLHGQRPGTLG